MHQPGRPPSNLTPKNASMGLLGRPLPPMLMNNIPNSVGVLNLTSNGPPSFRDERQLENNDSGTFNPKRVKLSYNENINYNDLLPQQHNFANIPYNKLNTYLNNSNSNNLKHKNEVLDHYPGINLINLNIINNNIKHFNNHNLIPNITNNIINNLPPSNTANHISKTPLKINTAEVKKESAYTLQVEAISPTPPSDPCNDDDIIKHHKEEILNNINRVDREIARFEQSVTKLHKKKDQLEEGQSKIPKATLPHSPASSTTPSDHTLPPASKQQSICQIVLAENQAKSLQSHEFLRKLNLLPLFSQIPQYSQVSDHENYQLNIKNFSSFKPKLIALLKRRKQYESNRSRVLSKRYTQMLEVWNRKMEKAENSSKKRLNDAKVREVFEKAFPELKRKREDKERSTRLTTTGNAARNSNTSTSNNNTIKQEVDVDLEPEQLEMKKRRENAVVIPPLLSSLERKKKWMNENGNLDNDLDLINMASMTNRCNYWTQDEKDVFKEKFISHPKSFASIATHLPTKTLNDCVLYYYGSKKTDNYKQLVRRHHMSRRKTDKAKKAQASKDVKEEKVDEGDSKTTSTQSSTTSTQSSTTMIPLSLTLTTTTTTFLYSPTSIITTASTLNPATVMPSCTTTPTFLTAISATTSTTTTEMTTAAATLMMFSATPVTSLASSASALLASSSASASFLMTAPLNTASYFVSTNTAYDLKLPTNLSSSSSFISSSSFSSSSSSFISSISSSFIPINTLHQSSPSTFSRIIPSNFPLNVSSLTTHTNKFVSKDYNNSINNNNNVGNSGGGGGSGVVGCCSNSVNTSNLYSSYSFSASTTPNHPPHHISPYNSSVPPSSSLLYTNFSSLPPQAAPTPSLSSSSSSTSSSTSPSFHIGGSIVLGTPVIMSQQQLQHQQIQQQIQQKMQQLQQHHQQQQQQQLLQQQSRQDYRESIIKDAKNQSNNKKEHKKSPLDMTTTSVSTNSSCHRNTMNNRTCGSPLLKSPHSKEQQSKEILHQDFMLAKQMQQISSPHQQQHLSISQQQQNHSISQQQQLMQHHQMLQLQQLQQQQYLHNTPQNSYNHSGSSDHHGLNRGVPISDSTNNHPTDFNFKSNQRSNDKANGCDNNSAKQTPSKDYKRETPSSPSPLLSSPLIHALSNHKANHHTATTAAALESTSGNIKNQYLISNHNIIMTNHKNSNRNPNVSSASYRTSVESVKNVDPCIQAYNSSNSNDPK